MSKPLSCVSWIILATSLTFSTTFSVPRAIGQKQDVAQTEHSSCSNKQNFSFVGTAIFAGCFCKQAEFEMLMCTAWKLERNATFKTSPIKVFEKFPSGEGVVQSYDAKGSCKKYAKYIINGLYGSDHLNFSNSQQNSPFFTDWSFCDDMQRKNNVGCNYTIVSAGDRNSSLERKMYHFVGSFTNSSQHLRLGNVYHMDVEKCEGASVVGIRVSALKGPSPPPKTTAGFFFPAPREHWPTSYAKSASTKTSRHHQRKQNIGAVLLDNFALCTVSLIASILASCNFM